MLTINLVFILRKSGNYSVHLFSNRNMNSAIVNYRTGAIVEYLSDAGVKNDPHVQTDC